MKLVSLKSNFSLLFFAFFMLNSALNAQRDKKEDVYVDSEGIMRWGHNKEEVYGFGVNYSVPFAHSYRAAEKKGLDIKAEMDKDIYHFSRLGFDLYRIHVWDTEISDEEGNLLENEHLQVFDYLLKELKDRNINFVITPIAYWGNGWPEPDEDTPGFSNKYGKENCLTNPEAIRAQQNYLEQFLNHVNPLTGVAYKDEPNLIALEISNEPHHRGTPEEVTGFINKMVSAMRKTGTKKPIFYNVSHSIHLSEAYFDADIQGGTFQWYPTGLGFKQELVGNLLPNVNDYDIPFEELIEERNVAKLVYEFDAADVNKSYIYPAMAKSLREAGIQLATHFAYDPTFLAYANTEYNTHYMNLNYTPHKALGLMIASEIFHNVELGMELGTYPDNLDFGDFRMSYEGDLATFNSGRKFIYTNSNDIEPKNMEELEQVAGHGSSRIVEYEGKGAYFLDRLEDGVWRLEVMPDPIMIKDPFGINSLDKKVSVISWKANKMKLKLNELGTDFQILGINEGNDLSANAENGMFKISPGTYLLLANPKVFDNDKFESDLRFELREFVAKESNVERTYLVHEAVKRIDEGNSLNLKATIASNDSIGKVEVWLRNGNTYETIDLEAENNYDYSAVVPEKLLKNGFLNYRIIVSTSGGKFTFPGGIKGSPADWDFHSTEEFKTRIEKKASPLYLFEASDDSETVVRKWSHRNNLVPVGGNETEFQVSIEQLFEEDIENKNAKPLYDYSFRYNFRQRLLAGKDELVVKARSLSGQNEKLQIAFVMNNGAAFGKIIELTPEIREIKIEIKELEPVKTVSLPRPYPGFLPYYFEHGNKEEFQLENAESLQFSIGPGIKQKQLQQLHEIGIRSVRLE